VSCFDSCKHRRPQAEWLRIRGLRETDFLKYHYYPTPLPIPRPNTSTTVKLVAIDILFFMNSENMDFAKRLFRGVNFGDMGCLFSPDIGIGTSMCLWNIYVIFTLNSSYQRTSLSIVILSRCLLSAPSSYNAPNLTSASARSQHSSRPRIAARSIRTAALR